MEIAGLCAICNKPSRALNTCWKCGSNVCNFCFDFASKLCVKCLSKGDNKIWTEKKMPTSTLKK